MLSSILRVVYDNPEWVAWKKASDDESLKCWNLAKIIEAEQFGDPTPKNLLSMDDLLCDLEEENDGNEDWLPVFNWTNLSSTELKGSNLT